MTKYKCPRCGEITEAVEKELVTRSGDNGFCKQISLTMKCCGFTPFISPQPYKEKGE